MTLPPAAVLRMMGIDPKSLTEMQKAIQNVDFVAIDKFIKELPVLTERIKKIDLVFQEIARTNSDLAIAVNVVYNIKKVEGLV